MIPTILLQILSLAPLSGPLDSAVVRDVEVAPGETLRTTSVGRGEPVVLIPGMFGAAFGYRSIMGPLVERGYRCIVVEPLGYGWSSHPKKADYSFAAQTERVAEALDSLGVTRALLVAQSSGASIAFRLAVARPNLVRGLLSIDGGPAESASTPGMRKAFKLGGFVAKLAMDESKLRHDVRREIVRNSGDTTWITDDVIHHYTAGQTDDLSGSIDAFERMSKSKEPETLGDRLHHFTGPVRLLVGMVEHPAEIPDEQRELLLERLVDFAADTVAGSGQYIHEEQPAVVVDAVAQLHRAAGE
ncbi:MAG TPA: alpha/beta hydrolase [Gemmatimonadales bacterium]|nr:alpha/beta hydrolase [Gemmatimonadales bacterium]